MKKRCYITTPIYYPSAEAHIGHAYCTVLSDVLARYKRLRGAEVFFLTGTDEHGQKIENKAKEAGVTPQEFVDVISDRFKKLWKDLDISNDHFIRTTDESHMNTVREVFSDMYKNGYIYLGNYEGWYCEPCESFWTDTQVGEEHICPDCGRAVKKAAEPAYFFKTNAFLDRLNAYFDKEGTILPSIRKNEMINTFIKPGLTDLCVTRTSFDWGIKINEDPKHVIYVWLDALFNYLSALGYKTENDDLFQKFWQSEDSEIIHIVGADITRFHTIYWPDFLMAQGLRLPDKVFVHGLLMTKDGKMSKSKGNVISPFPLIERFGIDAFRYYLVREINFGDNGQFTPEQFVERTNMDLVNNYGNLLSRSVSMIIKYFGGIVPEYQKSKTAFDDELDELIEKTISDYENYSEELKLTQAATSVMDLLSRANKYIEETTPWVLAKDETRIDELKSVMAHLVRTLYVSSVLLQPILISKTKDVFIALGLSEEEVSYENIHNEHVLDGKTVTKVNNLFPRLDLTTEVAYILENMKNVNK